MRIDRQALQSPQSADDALRNSTSSASTAKAPSSNWNGWKEASSCTKKEIPASRRSLPQRPQHRQRATQLPILPQPLQNHHAPAPPKPTPDSAMHYANLLLLRVDRDALPERAKQDAYWCMSQCVPHLRRHPEPQRNRPTCHPARPADPRRPHPQQRLHSPSPQQPLQHLQPQPRLRPAGPQPQRRRHPGPAHAAVTAGLDTLVLTPQRPRRHPPVDPQPKPQPPLPPDGPPLPRHRPHRPRTTVGATPQKRRR